jgi:hypothetical protein
MSNQNPRAMRPPFRGLAYVLLTLFVSLGVVSFVLAAIQSRPVLAALGAVHWTFAAIWWRAIRSARAG